MTKAQLRHLTRDLANGRIPEDRLYDAIHTLGDEGLIEAKPIVEQFLTHPDPGIRYIAINVLTIHWGCRDHRITCERMLSGDEDDDVRRVCVAGLGALLEGTRDAGVLRLLLSVFHNEREEWDVRDSAYSQILYVLGKPVGAQPSGARQLDYEKDVRWDWVREAEEIVRDG